MRIGWSLPLPGPFRIGGTVWRSKRRGYHGTLPGGWKCPHNHSRLDLAVDCANRYARTPAYQAQQRQAAAREAARTFRDEDGNEHAVPPRRDAEFVIRHWKGLIVTAVIAVLAMIGAIAGGSGSNATPDPAFTPWTPPATAPATTAPPASPAPAAYSDAQGCRDLAQWERTHDDTAGTSPGVQAIATKAAGTEFGADLAIWLGSLRGGHPDTLAAGNVRADCGVLGVDVLSDAVQAPATETQPAEPAPAETQAPAATGTHRAGQFCGAHGMTDSAGLTCTLTSSGTWHWEQ